MRWLPLLWMLLWCSPVPVTASPVDAESELALWVARVAVNEGAFKARAQAALVWQTARNAASTTERRAAWLYRHSPRVHGHRPCRGGNCRWTPQLERGEQQPVALGLPGDFWELKVLPFWTDTLRYVDWLVRGERAVDDPCHVTPRTWGCEADRPRALAQGLYPIGCVGTLDDGFTYAKDCYRGGYWVCDPRFEPANQSDGGALLWSSVAVR